MIKNLFKYFSKKKLQPPADSIYVGRVGTVLSCPYDSACCNGKEVVVVEDIMHGTFYRGLVKMNGNFCNEFGSRPCLFYPSQIKFSNSKELI